MKYKFSVIMPIYNTEEYLESAILSIVKQSIGFHENIQLILVNNACTDGSVDICKKYYNLFPDNVKYVHLEENIGPSGARNAGIPLIEGKYVNFFDSDDIWPTDAFLKVWNYFEKRQDNIDVISCRMKYFEARTDYYKPLDKKFQSGDRLCSIEKEYDALQLHVTSSFIKTKAIGKLRFDETMKHLEDSKFINTLIFRKVRYGVLQTVEYGYRRRLNQSSLLNRIRHDEISYYSHTLENYLMYFINMSIDKYGVVIPYIQWMIMYTIGNRLIEKVDTNAISPEHLKDYKDKIIDLLKYVDDRIIMECNTMWVEFKIYALSLKYKDFFENTYCIHRNIYYNNQEIYSLDNKNTLIVNVMEIQDKKLCIYGQIWFPFPIDSYRVFFQDNEGTEYQLNYDQCDQIIESLGEPFYKKQGFSVIIPLNSVNKTIVAKVDLKKTKKTRQLEISFRTWAKINGVQKNSYYAKDGYVVRALGKEIKVSLFDFSIPYERDYQNDLIKQGKRDIADLRQRAFYLRGIKEKQKLKIWLFMDRIASADDNSEFLCEYVKEHGNKMIKGCKIVPYYVITKDSPDLERIKNSYNCVMYGSYEYKILVLIADVAISSVQRLPEIKDHQYFKDLYPKRVYLQHGVVEKDISDTWCRIKCNDSIFISSAKKERDYFLKYKYGYTSNEVKLTGMPRIDKIIHYANDSSDNKKVVCFAPTWRNNLSSPIDPDTRKRTNTKNFVESEFFNFYNKLINDERILRALNKKNYSGVLRLHPYFHENANCFMGNDLIKVETEKKRFEEKYKDIGMVVTDYSSIAFDFAIINRLVVYAQFDVDYFYDNHSYSKGFFDYEKEGFGPVCFDYESTVETVIQAIEKDFKIDEKYRKRKTSFFKYFDDKNCERVFKEICKMEEIM